MVKKERNSMNRLLEEAQVEVKRWKWLCEAFLQVEEQLQLSREDAERKRSFVSQLQSHWGSV